MTPPLEIHWPAHYTPQNSPVHVRNELSMAASPDRVWAWLIRATLWPTWYFNSSKVQILNGPGPDLQKGTRFRWKTFDVTITSTVLEYVPEERIAWDAHALGVDAYHAWVLQPSPQGCHVLTEETQHGFLARAGKLLLPNRMSDRHQIWLERLERQAQAGLPTQVEVVIPRIWASMTEGTLTRWLVEAGRPIERDQPLFEMTTDKVDAEVPSPATGVLARILYPVGATIPVGTVVALIEPT